MQEERSLLFVGPGDLLSQSEEGVRRSNLLIKQESIIKLFEGRTRKIVRRNRRSLLSTRCSQNTESPTRSNFLVEPLKTKISF